MPLSFFATFRATTLDFGAVIVRAKHKARRVIASAFRVILTTFVSTAAMADIVVVPFEEGFVGAIGSSNRAADNVLLFSTLGISSSIVQQNSSGAVFESPTGNDIPVDLLLISGNDVLTIPGSINWKIKQGNEMLVFGFTPSSTDAGFQEYTISYGNGLTYTFDATRNYGLVRPPNTIASLGYQDGNDLSGSNDPVDVDELNAFLTETQASRPYGPIYVDSQTINLTGGATTAQPTITGEACLVTEVADASVSAVETISVVVNGIIYSGVNYTIDPANTLGCTSDTGFTVSTVNWEQTTTTPIPMGTYDVTASITSTKPIFNQLSDVSNNELTIIGSDPLLRLTKTLPVITSLSDGADLGDGLEYTITVENFGVVNVTMGELTDTFTRTKNSVSETITPSGTLSSASCSGGVSNSDTVLSAGETCVWTYSYSLGETDLDADTIENIATLPYSVDGNTFFLESSASGNETIGTPTDNKFDGSATKRQILIRELTARKTVSSIEDTNGDGKNSTGDTVHFEIDLSNTGEVDYTSVSLSTDRLTRGVDGTGAILTMTAPSTVDNTADTTLTVGETWTYTASYTLTQADIDAGGVSNIATFTGTPRNSTTPETIETSSSGNTTTGAGSGSVTSATITPIRTLNVVKTLTGTDLTVVGGAGDTVWNPTDTISYKVSVTNSGNVSLDTLKLSDPLASGSLISLTGANVVNETEVVDDDILQPGETWEYSYTYAVTQSDIDAGEVQNSATVTANDPSDTEITGASDSDADTAGNQPVTTIIDPSSELTVTKTFNASTLQSPVVVGDEVTWTVTAENTGNVLLDELSLEDTLSAGGSTYTLSDATPKITASPASASSLAPGASATWTVMYRLTQADIDAGELSNTATVRASTPNGSNDVIDVSDSDGATDGNGDGDAGNDPTVTSLRSNPGIYIEKIVDERDLVDGIRAGVDKLYYTITVRNDGSVSLYDLVLTDTMTDLDGGSLSLDTDPAITSATSADYQDGVLSVGETWVFTAEYTLTSETIATGGVENVALIEAVDPQGNPVVAQSKVDGNTNADGDPTPTGFPGEISGSVIEYQAGVPNIVVYLLEETASGVFEYVIDPETNGPVTATTDENGDYKFVGLPAGNYGVEFLNPQASTQPTAASAEYTETANRIIGIAVVAGAVEIDQDAFLVDPSGVVYDSLSYAPISGAVVTLYYQAHGGAASTVVPDSWLDTDLGDANSVTTAADGRYTFFLNPNFAQNGIYSLQAVKAGYNYVSQIIEPKVGPYNPGLGGEVVNVSSDETTSDTMDTTYYTSFRMVFDASNISATSNGVAQNHLPMDASIVPEIEEDLTEILKDDLAATMNQQSRQMSSFAAGARNRLKQRDGNTCAADIADILEQAPVQFATASAVLLPHSDGTLNAIAGLLETCPQATFEVAGHTDDLGSDEYNLQLSRARTASVVAALRQRGVSVDRLTSTSYGESRPIADNATEEGRQLNRRVEFVPLEAQAIAMPCSEMTEVDRNIDLQVNQNGVSGNGDFTSETRDCKIDGWRIFSGSASYLETDDGIAQSMFSLNYRVERFVNNDRLFGWFVGMYSAKDDFTGLATGTINGFGLNGGVYGALRLQENLFADYYLGAAAGRHTFILDFDRPLGVINVDGSYTYYALFAGAALSGEFDVSEYAIAPRAGVDVAWSPGGEADLTVSRAGFEEAGSLSTGAVSGGRVYAEVSFVDLLVYQPEVLSLTPRFLCDHGIGSAKTSCGYGATIEFSSNNDQTGETFNIAFDVEGTDDSDRYGLTVNAGQPLFGGQLKATGGFTLSGNLDVGLNFTKEY